MSRYEWQSAATSIATGTEKDWALGISTAMQAVGMVLVPCEGDVDWETYVSSNSSSIYNGFEVFRFDDDLQAAYPLFVRLDYGPGGTAGVLVTVGKGVNSTGQIQGVLIPGTPCTRGSGSGTTDSGPRTNLAASCPGRSCVAIVMAEDATGSFGCTAFIIERSRNNVGDATGDGVSFAWRHPSGTLASSAPPNGFMAASYQSGAFAEGAIPAVAPYRINGATLGNSSSLASGVVAPVLPWLAFAPGIAPWQPLAGLSYVGGDATPGGVVTVRALGADRTYRVVRLGLGQNGWGVAVAPSTGSSSTSNSKYMGLMLLWEDA